MSAKGKNDSVEDGIGMFEDGTGSMEENCGTKEHLRIKD